ncbi:MAG: magnesium transporter [Planctomycetes bacterium]|nr:magnesium transporter [Planctomycetota bacterium]
MDRAEGQLSPETNEVLADLKAAWPVMSPDERVDALKLLPEDEAEEFFLALTPREQSQLLVILPTLTRRAWLRLLPLDDAADVIQHAPREERDSLLKLLDEVSLREVRALLAYAEDEAGGLMNPRFARLRPEMTVDEAILYLRRQAQQKDRPIYYCYVLDTEQKLKGVLSFRQLLTAPAAKRIEEVMISDVVTVAEDLDQEKIAPLFSAKNLVALPVLDAAGRMKGVVSAEDMVDVVQEEATEDIQKMAGVAALEAPYLQVSILEMVRKRAGWLAILFLGGTLTASAIDRFDEQLSKWKILMAFIPLIISSGGNSGSQSATLVIRALALGELRLVDWWRVFRRELVGSLVLGLFLAAIGMLRVLIWQWAFDDYGEHFMRLTLTVAFSVLGVVVFGSLVGSLLPFALRMLKLDPATACTPFVATFCDVTGLVIYFAVCAWIYIPFVPVGG